MQFSTLKTRCAERYRDPDARSFSPTNWGEYLNEAYLEIITADPYWPFLEVNASETLAAGTNSVEVTDDSDRPVRRITSVVERTNFVSLVPLHGRPVPDSDYPDPAMRGIPTFYRVHGTALEVLPIPSQEVTLAIEGFVDPVELTAEDDEPIIPVTYHRYLVDGALSLAHEDAGHPQSAQRYRGRFDVGVQRLMREAYEPRTEEYPSIVSHDL